MGELSACAAQVSAPGALRRAGLALSMLAILLSLWPAFARAADASGGLVVEHLDGKVAVDFGPVANKLREGSFTLLLRNTDNRALRPRLTLDPADGAQVLRLHLVSPTSAPPRLTSVGAVPTIAPEGVARLSVLVDLPPESDPDAFDGTLVLRAVTPSLVPVDSATLLPIAASGLDLSTVNVVPTAVTLHTTTWLPLGSTVTGERADIELRGLGVGALIQAGRLDGRALLSSETGRTAQVQLGVEHRHNGEAQPFVQVLGRPEAGTYTGRVPISSSADAPSLSVTVISHDGIVWALAAVAVGTILGGLLPLLGARARQRNVLRARLQGLLREYFDAEANDKVMKWDGLSDAIGDDRTPWKAKEWMPEPDTHGAAGLFSRLHFAQNEGELTEVGEAIKALTARIARWLVLEPKVLALDQIQHTPMPDLDGTAWSSTGTRSDSQHLALEVAWVEPGADEAQERALLLQRQTQWHREVSGAWQQLAGAWTELEPLPREDLLGKIRELAFASPASGRSTEEWTDLRVKLADFLTDLVAVLPEGRLDSTAPMAEFVQFSTEGDEATGTAQTLIESAPVRGLRSAGGTVGRGLAHLLPTSKPARLIAASQRQDVLLSVVAAGGAMLVFVLQIYTSTWGSLTDYLAAIAAGFGAQVIVRWGALPVFESWEKRRA